MTTDKTQSKIVRCAATRCTRSFEWPNGSEQFAAAKTEGFNTYLDQSVGLSRVFLCEQHSDRMQYACDIIIDVVGAQRAKTSMISGGLASFVCAALKERKDRPTAVRALVCHEGKWLAVNREEDPGDMGLPGGTVEPGEQPWAACVRHLEEKTGVTFGTGPREVFLGPCDEFNVATYFMGVYSCASPREILLPRLSLEQDPDQLLDPIELCDGTLPELIDQNLAVLWLTEEELTHPRNSFFDYNRRLFEAIKNKALF